MQGNTFRRKCFYKIGWRKKIADPKVELIRVLCFSF
jgi:hypothetical protein